MAVDVALTSEPGIVAMTVPFANEMPAYPVNVNRAATALTFTRPNGA